MYLQSVISQRRLSDVFGPFGRFPNGEFLFLLLIVLICTLLSGDLLANTRLPGQDASDKLEAAGTLLRILDTGLFKWGARVLAGLCILSSGWNLKEQRFGIAILCILAAIILGTAPTWVQNIFNISGANGLFSMAQGAIHAFV